jgi:hypothetical protein
MIKGTLTITSKWLLTVAAVATSISISVQAGPKDDRAFSASQTPGTTYADWMSWVPDDVLLSELSLPGTHDTSAYTIFAALVPWTQTQTMDFRNQLLAGIRVMDIRVSHQNDSLWLYHGIVSLGSRERSWPTAPPQGRWTRLAITAADPRAAGFGFLPTLIRGQRWVTSGEKS